MRKVSGFKFQVAGLVASLLLAASCSSPAPKAEDLPDPTLLQLTKSAIQAYDIGAFDRAARFYELHFDSAEVTPQTYGEMGWILESNKSMNRAMEGMGGSIVRRYRLYERLFEDAGAETEVEVEAVPVPVGAPA